VKEVRLLLLWALAGLGLGGCPEAPAPPHADRPPVAAPQPPTPEVKAEALPETVPITAAKVAPQTLLDLGAFRAAVSLDGDRLAYLAQAPAGRALLFTVVTLPEGRRVTDFLLMGEKDLQRARTLLASGGYRAADHPLPEGIGFELDSTSGELEIELRQAGIRRQAVLGAGFRAAVRAVDDAGSIRMGVSANAAWLVLSIAPRQKVEAEPAWPRTVVAVTLRASPPGE